MLGLLAVAAGLTATVAMAPAPTAKTNVKAQAGELYWINADGSDGGFKTVNDKHNECGPEDVHCATGYQSLDSEGNGVGPGTPLDGEQR
nr:hypothetical protein [Pedobacter sp. ASV2]